MMVQVLFFDIFFEKDPDVNVVEFATSKTELDI